MLYYSYIVDNAKGSKTLQINEIDLWRGLMVSREGFNGIIEELNYVFAEEFGSDFHGIVVVDFNNYQENIISGNLVYEAEDKKIIVNYREWIEKYPYLGIDEYRNFLEENIRKEIKNNI